MFYKLGVRSIQLTYNYQNYVGSGCRERDNRGVTVFGRELIAKMNALRGSCWAVRRMARIE